MISNLLLPVIVTANPRLIDREVPSVPVEARIGLEHMLRTVTINYGPRPTRVPPRPIIRPLTPVFPIGEAAGGTDIVCVVHDAESQGHGVQAFLNGAREGRVLLVGNVVDGKSARQAGRGADRNGPRRRGRRVVRGDRRRLARRHGERGGDAEPQDLKRQHLFFILISAQGSRSR
jgi:hypothetical protein